MSVTAFGRCLEGAAEANRLDRQSVFPGGDQRTIWERPQGTAAAGLRTGAGALEAAVFRWRTHAPPLAVTGPHALTVWGKGIPRRAARLRWLADVAPPRDSRRLFLGLRQSMDTIGRLPWGPLARHPA